MTEVIVEHTLEANTSGTKEPTILLWLILGLSIGAFIMSGEAISGDREPHDERVEVLQQTMHQMQQDLEAMFARLEALVLANRPLLPTPPGKTPFASSSNHGGHDYSGHPGLPKPKLEAPKTDGSEPLRWLYKVNEYFAFYDTPPADRLWCVALMLEGPAADWFRWRQSGKLISGWDDFVEKFKLRFDPLHYVDYFAQLAKLRQTGSVMDYQTEFEKILQHATGASEANLISIFHSGLRPYLQHELTLLAPQTLSDSFALARELEAKHNALIHAIPQRQGTWASGATSRSPLSRPPVPAPGDATTDKAVLATPIRRLTRAEKLEKDAKGLCYNCDQRWSKGHRCGRVLLFIGDDDDAPVDNENDNITTAADPWVAADISSLQSLTGTATPRSLHLLGAVGTQELQVLIDGGSTHNLIHPRVVSKLQLAVTQVPPFRVYVGNGDYLLCDTQCPQVKLELQGTVFPVDLFVLQIHGPDAVLGVQWLQLLGKVAHDYSKLTMEFEWEGRPVILRGLLQGPKAVSLQVLQAIHSLGEARDYVEILYVHTAAAPPTDSPPPDLPMPIQQLLFKHAAVFQDPTGLPPRRDVDHRIFLQPGTPPVPDALSRRDEPPLLGHSLVLLSQPVPELLNTIRAENLNQPDLLTLHEKFRQGTLNSDYAVADDILYFRRRIYIGVNSELRTVLIREYHDTPMAGHSGIHRTFQHLAMVFYWSSMRRDIKDYVSRCFVCQTTKYSTLPPAGFLQPLPIPTQVWDHISMDFIVGLPPSRGFTVILVVVDRLSKYIHLGALPTDFDAHRVAFLFIDMMALYGREPPSFLPYAPGDCQLPAVDQLLVERTEMLDRLHQRLALVQQRMRAAADKHRRELSFDVGDLVLLKLQPYRQHSVATRRSQKLARRYYGPFEVLAKVGAAAYRLKLPVGARIHPVFHVSLLKPFRDNAEGVTAMPLPETFVHGDPISKPVRLHGRRTVLQDGKPVEQGLVQWSDGGLDDASWEPLDTLRKHFPHLHLEDEVHVEPGESVTSRAPEDIEDVGDRSCMGEVWRSTRIRRPPHWRKDYAD
ncbi:unnamed protein product [Cuscuta campestris]|uniref:Integrase zinc-binding domain-containing protein n=1 Tax=Cuscuta campestris TaxID=132261 RepID=A0A484KJ38_9ASTE|nr:unnamed protein product [Cuscuta campestris]